MATPTPNLTLTQYSTTDKITFVDNYNDDMGKIDSAVGANTINVGTLSSLKTAVKTSVVNSINEVYDTTDNGWINTRATLTYSDTLGTQFFRCGTNIDLTSRIKVGMKIKLTQTTTKYFFVEDITSNSITLLGNSYYMINSSTISNVFYSMYEKPYGFPTIILEYGGLGNDFIVEIESNTQGHYAKWFSGKLEMWGIIPATIASSTLVGSIYSATTSFNTPIASVSAMTVNVSFPNNFGAWSDVSSATTTSNIAVNLYKATSGGFSASVHYQAIGTWKAVG